MKINVLDKKVYNRIAAGEVVERPFSVIKELVENSIDAGAKNITISIWNGGKDRVEITDDGCGIEKSELHKAFLPHATSKIADVKDLDNIATLGFRGEALASIASVAKVTIVSKPESQEFGATIYSEGGNVSDVTDAPSGGGTKITVDDLFFNTPVRAKFLKTTRAEEGDITDIVGRLVLANPYISFKYFVDDRLILQSYGGGEEEAVIAVYGANTVKNCFEIQTVKNGIGIRGYIGKHNFTKSNRTYQTLVINGRYVINSTVSVAMQNAYQAYLMKRQYPFFVLYLTVPTEEVDVNVHPNKTDVRFSNNQVVYGAIYSVVSKVLDGSNEALEIIKNSFDPSVSPIIVNESKDEAVEGDVASPKVLEKPEKSVSAVEKKRSSEEFSLSFAKVMDSGVATHSAEVKPVVDIFAENKRFIEEMEKKKQEKSAASSRSWLELDNSSSVNTELEKFEDVKKQENKNINQEAMPLIVEQSVVEIADEFKYIGQAMKTYLIFEKSGDLFFIDQHAAHERLLFDLLYDKAVNGIKVSQQLLIPYVLNLNSIELGYFESRKEYLEELGFVVEDFGGGSYKVTEVPVDVAEMRLDVFFAEMLADVSLRQEKIPSAIREKLCQRACKSAIKAGFELSRSEIDALMLRLNGDMGLKCPHGRPIAVRITGTEIEKWFKRIV